MKEMFLTIALLLSLAISVEGQSNDKQKPQITGPPQFAHEDECGSPLVESQVWMSVKGMVIEVVDGETIIVQTKDNKQKRVTLVAIDASASQFFARHLLSELVLNKSVSVLVNPSKIESATVVGEVHENVMDVNQELLKAGAVKYRKPEAYSVSGYTSCIYRIAEREARQAKMGLWRSASR